MDPRSMDQTPSKKPSIENKTLEIEYSDNQEHSGCVDFISNMPDDILCRIISKLPTKFAIGTSILSTRWKHLFSLIPETFLDFDDSLLLHPTAPPPPPPSGLTVPSKERKTCFVNFMYRVMDVILKDVPTAFKFRLKLNQYYEDYQIIDWVLAALVHGVMWFELVFSLDHASSLFDCLSGWTSVHYLKLENSIIHAYGSFSLPNLKKLVINDSVCAEEDSLPHLLYGSPVLEDLTMHYCYLGELETLNISIPTLRFLIIEYCYNEAVPYELVLDTPKLDLLFYQDNVAKGYTVKNLSTLVNAQICFGEFDHLWEGDISKYDQNVADLITGCSSVDSLCISKASLSFFYNSGREWPMFCNLKLLQLFGFDTDGWELLPKIIESAPNLESLDITEGFYEEKGCYERFASSLPPNVPVCLTSHLKHIEIWSFKGEEDEVKLVEYFLNNAKVLNKIDISCDMSREIYFYTKKKLFSLPRISETCQLWVSKNK